VKSLTQSSKLFEVLSHFRTVAAFRNNARHILRITALAGVYFVIARVGFNFAPGKQITAIWPAAGVSLASILLFGYRMWPGILLGSFLSKLSVEAPPLTGFLIAVSNTVEPLIGAWLLNRYAGAGHYLERIRGVLCLWFFASLISALAGAALGAAALWLGGLHPPGVSYGLEFLTWWLADASGAFIVAPLLLAWGNGAYFMPPFWMGVEAAGLMVASIATCAVIFTWAPTRHISLYPYMAFPLIIWAAIRFGQRGSTLLAFAIANVCFSATLHHVGPFAVMPVGHDLIAAQIFVMIVTLVGLTVCAAISERVTSEQLVHSQLKYLRTVIDHIPDPVLIKNRQHHLIGGNQALWALLGGPPEKFLNQNCNEAFLNKDEVEAFNRKYDRVFATGKTDVSEAVFTDQAGKRHVLSIKIAPLKNERGTPSLVAIARDISDLKETELLLLKYATDLEIKNQELDDFAHVASHDLKEPLRGINIVSALLLEDYGDKLDADAVKRLSRLTCLSRHVSRLVDDLLHYSRLGLAAFVPQRVDLNATVNDIRILMEQTLKENNARIVVPRTLPDIECDKAGLEEILRNLIGNAIKYNDKEVKTVEVGMIDNMTSPYGRETKVFYVKDNGIGVAPRHQQDIFRIFRRLPESARYDAAGTGVGLTFVKKIIERNQGRIWLESESGKGSTFYFTLDRCPVL
jgi:PAS domain S-box-containing protein